MTTKIEKLEKGVYRVNNKKITLIGGIIQNNQKSSMTTNEIKALMQFLNSEQHLKIKSTIS